ncbi:MAG: hypothetical protein AAF351_02960 [Pseudomonadota bacterium]
MITHTGHCHCRAIGFGYTTEIAPSKWSVRACQCRFCRQHDALSASDPNATLGFSATRDDCLQRYRFGLKTADFLLCRQCGVYIGAVIETAGRRFGIINTHALDEQPADIAAPGSIHYDGEQIADRVDRRERVWTPVTTVPW